MRHEGRRAAALRARDARQPEPDTATVWPGGAAVLTRQAIETTLDAYWQQTSAQMRFAADHALVASPRAVGRQLLHYTELQAALVKTSDRRVDDRSSAVRRYMGGFPDAVLPAN